MSQEIDALSVQQGFKQVVSQPTFSFLSFSCNVCEFGQCYAS